MVTTLAARASGALCVLASASCACCSACRICPYAPHGDDKAKASNKEAAHRGAAKHPTPGNPRRPLTHHPVIHGPEALEAARRSDNANLATDDEAIRCASLCRRSSLAPQLPALCTTVAVCQQDWGALSGCDAAGVGQVSAHGWPTRDTWLPANIGACS